MKYSIIPSAQAIVHHCKAFGIKNIVISPGSRNAPLTIGFSEDPFFRCFSIVDERSAAFFAIGIAQRSREPVVVVCSSGSALLNYYPAIAEAFYSDLPLVVVSADRPPNKVDIGDGQTIRQPNVFSNHIGYSANLQLDVEPDEVDAVAVRDFNEKEVRMALEMAWGQRVPVHINVPFEEPLYKVTDTPLEFGHYERTMAPSGDNEWLGLEEAAGRWNNAQKKMILIGVNHPDELRNDLLDKLAEDDSVLVFTETTSNLHNGRFFNSIDSIIAPIEKSSEREELFKALRPDILLTFGGLLVSKKIKAFLRDHRPVAHWHVGPKGANDTFFSLTSHFKGDPNGFLKDFVKAAQPIESGYFHYWNKIRTTYISRRKDYLKTISFSDMLAFHHIFTTVPHAYQLQLANSSTVRYAQLFDLHPSLTVFCNRGTSGIDGSTSTAVGAALFHREPTLYVTGDLSFLYDSNGLWNNYIRPDFRIIVINNGGGGIFRILPGQEDTENFETFFETVHQLDASHLCEMYRLEYSAARDDASLIRALEVFYDKSTVPKLLEVHTPRLSNNKILLGYFDFIS
ncbi:MAG: 2-succinyl-5-enolpyruvyl-6-hydroxy-3-cyclohexene-1-carboxylic-acid synthase [Sediminicola sp.]